MSLSQGEAFVRFSDLAARIEYPGVSIEVSQERVFFADDTHADVGLCLRVVCADGTCNVTGARLPWKGRKWRLSRHMTDMEVVSTAFLAILTALEHEARERFLVDGVAIMDSHRDLDLTLAFMRAGGGGHGRD